MTLKLHLFVRSGLQLDFAQEVLEIPAAFCAVLLEPALKLATDGCQLVVNRHRARALCEFWVEQQVEQGLPQIGLPVLQDDHVSVTPRFSAL